MDSMDELRSPSLPTTSPAAPIIVFPLPFMLSVLQLLGTIRCPEKPRAAHGGGDAKLAATALWLGFGPLADYLIISTMAGGLLTVLILGLRGQPLPAFALGWGWVLRLHERKAGVPYSIALAGAALVVYPHSPIWTAVLAR